MLALNMDILFRAFIMVSCEFRLSTVLNVRSLLYWRIQKCHEIWQWMHEVNDTFLYNTTGLDAPQHSGIQNILRATVQVNR